MVSGSLGASSLTTPSSTALTDFREGEAALKRGDNVRAIERLTAAHEQSPTSSAIPYLLGIAYYRIGGYGKAEDSLLQAAKLAPRSEEVWQSLAAVCRKTNNRAGLVSALENLVRLKPKDKSLRKSLAALRAETSVPKSSKPATEAQIRQYLKQRPNDVNALVALAGTLHARKDYPGALEQLRRASELAPERAAIWADMAATYQLLQKPGEAIRVSISTLRLAKATRSKRPP